MSDSSNFFVSIHAYMGLSYAGNVYGNLKYYACERGVENIFLSNKLPVLLKFNTLLEEIIAKECLAKENFAEFIFAN